MLMSGYETVLKCTIARRARRQRSYYWKEGLYDSIEYKKAAKIFDIKSIFVRNMISSAFEETRNSRFNLYFFNEFNYASESYVRFLLYENEIIPNLEFAINVDKTDFSDVFSFFRRFNERCLDEKSFVPEIVDTGMNCINEDLFDFVFDSEFQKYLVFYRRLCMRYDSDAVIDLFNHCSILDEFPDALIRDGVVKIPDSVRILKNHSIHCKDIRKVIIPKSVERIEDHAFEFSPEGVEIICENPDLKLPVPSVSHNSERRRSTSLKDYVDS